MKQKIIILLSGLLKKEEQKRFSFLDNYDVDYEYVEEYLDDDREPIERHLQLEKNGPDSFNYSENYIAKLQEADILVSFYSPVPSAVFNKGNTEAVIILRGGVENVDVNKATNANVKVINAPGRLAVPVAEFTIGLIIAEMKNIAKSHCKLMQGDWCTNYSNSSYIYNIKGRSVGIVGYGTIGKRVAEVMRVMEANVNVFDPYCDPNIIREKGYTPVTLDELCEKSDIISIHYRLTPETENMINEEHFNKMKKTAYLINTARAGLVNEAALLEALENKKIAGAALDVYHCEPLPKNSRLLKLDNVTLTPHIAGTCTELMDLTLDVVKKCIITYLDTGVWTNVVNN